MCTTCGCEGDGATIEHHHGHSHAHNHPHGHDHDHAHPHTHVAPDAGQLRRVAVEQDILSRNNAEAAANRGYLAHVGAFALNLVSSPG